MTKINKIASAMYYTIGGICILMGIVYTVTPRIMPYHERFLGLTHQELVALNPKFTELIIQALRLLGGFSLSLGAGFILLVKKYLTAGGHSIRWVLLTMSILALVPLIKTSLVIGHQSPWWLFVSVLVLAIAAFILASPEKRIINKAVFRNNPPEFPGEPASPEITFS